MESVYIRKTRRRKPWLICCVPRIKTKLNGAKVINKPIIIVASFILITLAFFVLFDLSVRRPAAKFAENKALEEISEILSASVRTSLIKRRESGNGNFTRTETASDGTNILYIDAQEMSIISAEIIARAQEMIAELESSGFLIPIGTATGSSILNGKGPKIKVAIDTMGAVTGEFDSAFTDAGVNQTKYSAYLNLNASVAITVCGRVRTVSADFTAPICETIIVGAVPQAYTNVRTLDEALNLIPTDVDN